MQEFFITFLAISLLELGDKSQLSIFILSSRTKNHFQLLLGVMLAFLIVDSAAILLGTWITTIVPISILRIVSGTTFIAFGLFILIFSKDDGGETATNKSAFRAGFFLIFISEWGDKTQIASGLLATNYSLLPVFLGTMAALFVISLIAIYLGKFASERLDKRLIAKVAGALFILIGVSFFVFN